MGQLCKHCHILYVAKVCMVIGYDNRFSITANLVSFNYLNLIRSYAKNIQGSQMQTMSHLIL